MTNEDLLLMCLSVAKLCCSLFNLTFQLQTDDMVVVYLMCSIVGDNVVVHLSFSFKFLMWKLENDGT